MNDKSVKHFKKLTSTIKNSCRTQDPNSQEYSDIPRAVPELRALPSDKMVCITRRNFNDSLT